MGFGGKQEAVGSVRDDSGSLELSERSSTLGCLRRVRAP